MRLFAKSQELFIKHTLLESHEENTAVGFNFGTESFGLYLVNHQTKKVYDLVVRINRELLESTRSAFIEQIQWTSNAILVVAMTNGNILCFTRLGNHVRLLSERMILQSITPNRQ